MDAGQTSGSATDLGDYARRLRRRGWVVVLGVLVGLAGGAAFAALSTPRYEATTSVLVRSVAVDPEVVGGPSDDVNLDTQAQIVLSSDVAALVAEDLGTERTPESLREDVSVSVPPNSQVMAITFAATTAQDASDGAEAYGQAYLDQRREEGQAVIEQEVQALNSQLESLRSDLAATGAAATVLPDSSDTAALNAAQRSVLVDQISEVTGRLTPLLGAEVSGGRVITPASAPSAPARPVLAIDLAAGLLLGLLLGLAVAALLETLDHRAHRGADVTRRTGLPVLAHLGTRSAGFEEAVTDVAAARSVLALRSRASSVVTVQDFEGAGTGSAAPALATSLALAGHRTVLVLTDERSSSAELLGTEARPGLREVLSERLSPEDMLVDVPGADGLHVLPVGLRGGDPRDLLDSPAFRRLLDELRLSATRVVVETSSSKRSPATLTVASAGDAVVLVASRGRTDLRRLRSFRTELEGRGGEVQGVVLVDRPAGGRGRPPAAVRTAAEPAGRPRA